MSHFPSPPIVSAVVSGFVVGVFVTLAATGIFSRPSHTQALATLPPPTPVSASLLVTQVRRLVLHQLGPFTADKERRLLSVQVSPVSSAPTTSQPTQRSTNYRSVQIIFQLNDHPLGPAWRLKAAKADIFGVMKALYTSNLPIYDAKLIGRFAVRQRNHSVVVPAVVAYETHSAAMHIPWRRWGRENEALLWNELAYKRIDRRFA